ncbi:hypothetical protein KUCAC02_012747, partial [Chaenocephalus aceratus]
DTDPEEKQTAGVKMGVLTVLVDDGGPTPSQMTCCLANCRRGTSTLSTSNDSSRGSPAAYRQSGTPFLLMDLCSSRPQQNGGDLDMKSNSGWLESHAKERFSFTKHLISATLLQGDLFEQHSQTFPEAALKTTVEAYPLLDKAKLKTELSLVYDTDQFRACSGAVNLLQFFVDNNLQETFTET